MKYVYYDYFRIFVLNKFMKNKDKNRHKKQNLILHLIQNNLYIEISFIKKLSNF